MLALFPFEPPLYEEAGIPVTYVGHPMAQDAATHATRRETRELLQHARQPRRCSRCCPAAGMSEIEMHAELVLDTAARLLEARADAQFLVPFVTRATRDAFESAHASHAGTSNLPITLLYGHAEDALRAADVALVASGTATLEAALARCPHVIFYRVSRLTGYLVQRKLLLPYVGLPNVLAGRFVVPEFLQERRDAAQSRAGRAQPLRRHGDAPAARGALRGLRATSCRPTPARSRPRRWQASSRSAGVAC